MSVPLIDNVPFTFVTTDTAYGIEIDPPWGTSTITISSAVFNLYTETDISVSPYTGQSATVEQTSTTTQLQWTFPTSGLPAGNYVGWFTWTDSGSLVGNTNGVLINVVGP